MSLIFFDLHPSSIRLWFVTVTIKCFTFSVDLYEPSTKSSYDFSKDTQKLYTVYQHLRHLNRYFWIPQTHYHGSN